MSRHREPRKISAKQAKQPLQGRIPDRVAMIAESGEPEEMPFHISYRYYNDDLCQMKLLEKNGSKECLKNLRDVGRSTKTSLPDRGIDSLRIKNEGTYSVLFAGKVTPDTEMKEHIIMGTQRLFYFTQDNLFHIVAITNAHIPLGKNRG